MGLNSHFAKVFVKETLVCLLLQTRKHSGFTKAVFNAGILHPQSLGNVMSHELMTALP